MLALPRYIVALVIWISLFFNIERLHINKSELIHVAVPVYILAGVLLVLGLVLPQVRPLPIVATVGISFFSFLVVKVLHGVPFWGDAYTFVTLFELTAVLITAALAHRVGQLIADLNNTFRGLFDSDLKGRVHSPEEADLILRHEMQLARRRNQSVTLLLVEADTRAAAVNPTVTAREVQQLIARRMGLVTITRLFSQNLRASDTIVNEIDQGRWLLMTSAAFQDQASAIVERLNDEAKKRHGIRLRYGTACFPEEGITFDDLIARAEQNLKVQAAEWRTETGGDPAPMAVDATSVNYSSYRSSTDG